MNVGSSSPGAAISIQQQLKMFMYSKGINAQTLLQELQVMPRDIVAWMQGALPQVLYAVAWREAKQMLIV